MMTIVTLLISPARSSQALLVTVLVLVLLLPSGFSTPSALRWAGSSEPELSPGPLVINMQGPVELVGPARWQIAGQVVVVLPDTAIVEPDGPTVPGMWAWVQAQLQEGEPLVARRIETLDHSGFQAVDRSLTGIIERVEPDRLQINQTQVLLSAETRIVGEPVVGRRAFVLARPEGDDLLARLVVVFDSDVGDLVYVEGELLSFTSAWWQLRIGQRRVVLLIDDDTIIEGQAVVGDWVEAVGLETSGQVLQARFIQVIDPSQTPQSFLGRLQLQITSTVPQQWILLMPEGESQRWQPRWLWLDPANTVIDDSAGPIELGAWLEVLATPPTSSNGGWEARVVRTALPLQGTLLGTLRSLGSGRSPDWWQVGSRWAVIDAQTHFDGRPRQGLFATVSGTVLPGDGVWAAEIASRYRFQGTLIGRRDDLIPRMWIVQPSPTAATGLASLGKVFFIVDAQSQIDPSVAVGGVVIPVEVTARATAAGWVADSVRDLR